MDQTQNDDFMAILTGVEDSREDFRALPDAVSTKPEIGPDTFRGGNFATDTDGQIRVDTAPQHHFDVHGKPNAVDTGHAWMLPVSKEQPFLAPQLQPFFQEDSVTQFSTQKPVQEIYNALLRAMRENECMYSADREKGTIRLTAFVDHSRVEATVRVYRTNSSNLVLYGREYGDRIPATRLFFTLANASKLVQLQLPRLLRKSTRRCCTSKLSDGGEEKATDVPEAAAVYVDMLSSMFVEEALVGAQGIARACCCVTAARHYVPYLQQIVAALQEHQTRACDGHLVCRDVSVCLAQVVDRVSSAALDMRAGSETQTLLKKALFPLLQAAALVHGDAENARFSLNALSTICQKSATIRAEVLKKHRLLVNEATTGKGPCSVSGDGEAFLKASARRLQDILSL